jgi:hypothetical protein
MSRPTYVRLGSTSAFPGLTYNFPGRNMFFLGRYSCLWTGISEFRPLLAGINRCWADFGLPPGGVGSKHPGWAVGVRGFPACSALGLCPGPLRVRGSPAPSALGLRPGWAAASSPGWAALRFRPRLGLGPSTAASPPGRTEFLPASSAASRQASPV